ncbi:hypothetical protein ACFX1Q_046379 [Malus domestica]
MLVPVDDILFHKRARKHRVRPALKLKSQEEVLKIVASKKDEAEAIGCATAIDLKVMTKYDDRLQEVEWYKAKFKKNKQLVNDARKMSKALADAIYLKNQNFKSLKMRNGENVRLKKQFEVTKKQLETTILEVSKVKGELDNALVEVFGLKKSIPTERNATVQSS